jgi:hypothetical protein
MTPAESVFVCVVAGLASTITMVAVLWKLFDCVKGIFDLGRKTAKRYPWRTLDEASNTEA